jgi:Tol biopolymer transport system component
MRWQYKRVRIAYVLALVATLVCQQLVASAAEDPANEHFLRVWERTDRPVADGDVERTWMWGPAVSGELSERYGAPDVRRAVQYFDKSRMEITDPNADPASGWYVTNGLLAVELISGRMQVGDNGFEQRLPSELNVAGDQGFANGPSYATFREQQVRESQFCDGEIVCERIARSGIVTFDPSLAEQAIAIAQVDDVTGHNIAGPFWLFMTSMGEVYDDGELVAERLFENPYYATGRPIAEPYWADVVVGGMEQLVLIQCFERRCLTYTPANPGEWRVEAGNIGQHYFSWRYAKTPNPGGELIFYRNERDATGSVIGTDLYTVSVDGSAVTNLTSGLAGDVSGAAWSPDGSQIAFVGETGNGDLYVMDADGGNRQQITSGDAVDSEPDWSPDGSQIAFTRTSGDTVTDIWVINADGTGARQVTDIEPDPEISRASSPDWSPDGQQIAFANESHIVPLISVSGIYVIDIDGSDLRELVPQQNAFRGPDWSPDGETILFVRPHLGGHDLPGSVLYTVDADAGASSIRRIAGEDFTHPDAPIWTPDGTSITMTHTPAMQPGVGASAGPRGITTIDPDTLAETQITHFGEDASWSSNGQYLAYEFYSVSGNNAIAITDASGLTQWIVTDDGSRPQWRPAPDTGSD